MKISETVVVGKGKRGKIRGGVAPNIVQSKQLTERATTSFRRTPRVPPFASQPEPLHTCTNFHGDKLLQNSVGCVWQSYGRVNNCKGAFIRVFV